MKNNFTTLSVAAQADEYEIRYNSASHMFEVLYRGERIDWMLRSYADGENSIQLHASIKQANDDAWAWAFANAPVATTETPCDAGMQRALATIRSRYPGIPVASWHAYVTAIVSDAPVDPKRFTLPYAAIALPDGYAVHHVFLSSQTLGAHIETVRWHDAEPVPAVEYLLAA